MLASIRDPDPVIFFEPKVLYRSAVEEVRRGKGVKKINFLSTYLLAGSLACLLAYLLAGWLAGLLVCACLLAFLLAQLAIIVDVYFKNIFVYC